MDGSELTRQPTFLPQEEGIQPRAISEAVEMLRTFKFAPEDTDNQNDVMTLQEDGSEVFSEENIAKSAFGRTRALLAEKAQQAAQQVFNRRRLGTIAAASSVFTIGYPAVEAVSEKAPTSITRAAAAEAVDYGTGGYPWAHLTPGTGELDGNGHPVGECGAWVAWRLQSTGRDPSRALNSRVTGEIIDNNPAIGAAADTADGKHTMYVEDVTDTHITLSDYNGIGGPYKYGIQTLERTNPYVQGLIYTHFELPDPRGAQPKETPEAPPANKAEDVYANLKKLNRNVITANQPVREGSFLESKDGGQYRLVVSKGDIKLRDTEADDKVKWSAKTNKQATQLQIKLGKGKQRGKNFLTFGNNKKDYRKWNIGAATKVEIGDDGKLAGYKGKKQVWGEAKNLAAAQRAATRSVKSKITKRSAIKSK